MKYILLGDWGFRYADDLFSCSHLSFTAINDIFSEFTNIHPKLTFALEQPIVEYDKHSRYNYNWVQEPYSILHFQKTYDNRHCYCVVVWFMFPALPHSQVQILCCWVFMYLISLMNSYFIHPNEIWKEAIIQYFLQNTKNQNYKINNIRHKFFVIVFFKVFEGQPSCSETWNQHLGRPVVLQHLVSQCYYIHRWEYFLHTVLD